VRIPCLEDSKNTQRANVDFNKRVYNAGWHDGWLTNDEMSARAKKAPGAAPDSDEDDVAGTTVSRMLPATDGQLTESDSATSENLFLSEREMEQVEPEQEHETKTSADLYLP
jgi:hypothetical protein